VVVVPFIKDFFSLLKRIKGFRKSDYSSYSEEEISNTFSTRQGEVF